MAGMVIPMRPLREQTSALACIDVLAADLLTAGRADSLSAARIAAMLAKLRAERTVAETVIADLGARPPSGDCHIDAINADLSAAACEGAAQIEMLIHLIETWNASLSQTSPACLM